MYHDRYLQSCGFENILKLNKLELELLPSLRTPPQKIPSSSFFHKSPSVVLSLKSSNNLRFLTPNEGLKNFQLNSPVNIKTDKKKSDFVSILKLKNHCFSSPDLNHIDHTNKPIMKLFQFIPKIKAKHSLKPLARVPQNIIQYKTKLSQNVDFAFENQRIVKNKTLKPREREKKHVEETKIKFKLAPIKKERSMSPKIMEANKIEKAVQKKDFLKSEKVVNKDKMYESKSLTITGWDSDNFQ